MPNWCSNRLIVSGDPDQLADFAARVTGPDEGDRPVSLCFGSVLPTPAWLEGVQSTGLDLTDFFPPFEFTPDPSWGPNQVSIELESLRKPADWYTWRLAKWGTKWDLDAETMLIGSAEGGMLSYGFESAWAPPSAWVVTTSRCWPSLSFDLWYAEPSMDFAGRIVIRDGVFAIDEAWQGVEAHDQLQGLGWEVYTDWEPDEEDYDCADEVLPVLDKDLWVWDETPIEESISDPESPDAPPIERAAELSPNEDPYDSKPDP